MQSKNEKSDYTKSVLKLRNARRLNAALCAAGVAACFIICFALFGEDSRPAALATAAAAATALLSLLAKNLMEAAAVIKIAETGAYAAKPSADQQAVMRRNRVREGRSFYLSMFLAILLVEGVALTAMYKLLSSEVFLLFLGFIALACFAVALFSTFYLSARMSIHNPYCTVSAHGIISCGEVIMFNAGRGDARQLTAFDDYMLLECVRSEIFGIRHKARVLVPMDGAVKNGEKKDPARAVREALSVKAHTDMVSPYYESLSYDSGKRSFKAQQN